MKKIGRNALCPCGSGKKYKKCCLRIASVSSFGWQRMRRTETEISRKLGKFLDQNYSDEVLFEALEEFTIDAEFPVGDDFELEMESLFYPWYLYNWLPESHDIAGAEDSPELSIAAVCLQQQPSRFDAYQQRFINEACSQPFSFFMVTHVIPGKEMSLRDLLHAREVTVHERQASRTLQKGEIMFARVVQFDDDAIMLGCSSIVIPATYINEFIDLRESLKRDEPSPDLKILHEFDYELRYRYFAIRDELCNPALPQIANTDGDPLQLTKLYYSLNCSPIKAARALATLSMASSDEEFLQQGKFDAGELVSISFPWLQKGNQKHKSWDNTVLGQLVIEGKQLTIDVNSQKRADAIKRKITRRLGKRATFQHAVIQSVEKMLEDIADSRQGSDPGQARHEELQNLPEIKQKLSEMSSKHWQSWLDEALPALKNETPREAAKHPIGQERLQALLWDFEHKRKAESEFAPDVGLLRKALGLD